MRAAAGRADRPPSISAWNSDLLPLGHIDNLGRLIWSDAFRHLSLEVLGNVDQFHEQEGISSSAPSIAPRPIRFNTATTFKTKVTAETKATPTGEPWLPVWVKLHLRTKLIMIKPHEYRFKPY